MRRSFSCAEASGRRRDSSHEGPPANRSVSVRARAACPRRRSRCPSSTTNGHPPAVTRAAARGPHRAEHRLADPLPARRGGLARGTPGHGDGGPHRRRCARWRDTRAVRALARHPSSARAWPPPSGTSCPCPSASSTTLNSSSPRPGSSTASAWWRAPGRSPSHATATAADTSPRAAGAGFSATQDPPRPWYVRRPAPSSGHADEGGAPDLLEKALLTAFDVPRPARTRGHHELGRRCGDLGTARPRGVRRRGPGLGPGHRRHRGRGVANSPLWSPGWRHAAPIRTSSWRAEE
jgi:hypothetical protein